MDRHNVSGTMSYFKLQPDVAYLLRPGHARLRVDESLQSDIVTGDILSSRLTK
jgi:hypothetical protein